MIPSRCGDYGEELAIQNGYDSGQVKFFAQLCQDYDQLRFKIGKKFAFRPPKTIILGPPEPFSALLALHEVSHAICRHRDFRTDVERLKMEMQAWEKARELASAYGVEVDEGLVQRELDTYRDWLHQKSRCPECGLTRFETSDGVYHCPRCESLN